MAVDSKFFNIPFATSGDKATIPEAVDAGGAVSFTQGFGPDYERDPATDPLAKRVPRDETNELYYEITLALKYLQLYGTPQYTSVADGGPANYPISARVRYDAGAGMQAWRSVVATNTAVPGADATKWVLDDTVGEATLAEALAGAIGGKGMTPRRTASAAQQNPWNSATATGTATALVVTLAPAPAAYTKFLPIDVQTASAATGATTINVNGLGAKPVVDKSGAPIGAGFWQAGDILTLIYDGTSFRTVGGQTTVATLFSSTYGTSQSIPSNTYTKSALTSGSADFGAIASNTFTFTRPGLYAISAALTTTLNWTGPSNAVGDIQIRKNGAPIVGATNPDGNYGNGSTSFVRSVNSVLVPVVAGDTIEVYGLVGSSSGFISGAITNTTLTILQVS